MFEKRIKFLNLSNEGHKYFSFVACEYSNFIGIIYAWVNTLDEKPHTQIFHEAIIEFNINQNNDPIGGGSINSATLEYAQSLHYGSVDQRIEHAARRRTINESR